jgi:hypothetical protein
MSTDVQAERSRLLNRQKKDRSELEKDVKKKKGAMKTAAQAQLDQLEADQARELAEFDKAHGLGDSGKSDPVADNSDPVAPTKVRRLPMEVPWHDLSKKELIEECAMRNISKGGGKEELVTRLICWAAEEKTRRSNAGEPIEDGHTDEEESEHSSDDDSVSSEGEEDDIPDMTEDQKLEAEKQYKRELIVRKAILHLFETKFHDGFPLDELPEYLARIKVMNFKPESLGYSSLHEFARKQPREAIFYDKAAKYIRPVHKRK